MCECSATERHSDRWQRRQRHGNDTQLTLRTHCFQFHYELNEHGTVGDVLFAVLSECERDDARRRIRVYTCVHGKLPVSNRPHEPCYCHWRGSIIQLCSWHGTSSYPWAEQDGAFETTATNCSVCQTTGRQGFICRRCLQLLQPFHSRNVHLRQVLNMILHVH